MARFEVVIPYFQRDPGHLVNALSSIFAQDLEDVLVHVVDDGSPRAAALDLEMMPASDVSRVNLVVQENTGANAARNRGLAEVSPDARYVAFLDSDDAWLPGHLDRAAAALERPGTDFFYDTIRIDDALAAKYRPPEEFLDKAHFLCPNEAPHLLEITRPLNVLCGEWYRHLHLSATVLTGNLARRVRFNPHFTIADDFEFFYQCARVSSRWIVDTRNGAERGAGANIWHGIKTSELRYSQEKYYSMLVLSRICRERAVDEAARALARERIGIYREQFIWAQSDRVASGRWPSMRLWAKYMIMDPKFAGGLLSKVIGRAKQALS